MDVEAACLLLILQSHMISNMSAAEDGGSAEKYYHTEAYL